ncbi:mCG145449, partial [Mus musculus]
CPRNLCQRPVDLRGQHRFKIWELSQACIRMQINLSLVSPALATGSALGGKVNSVQPYLPWALLGSLGIILFLISGNGMCFASLMSRGGKRSTWRD